MSSSLEWAWKIVAKEGRAVKPWMCDPVKVFTRLGNDDSYDRFGAELTDVTQARAFAGLCDDAYKTQSLSTLVRSRGAGLPRIPPRVDDDLEDEEEDEEEGELLHPSPKTCESCGERNHSNARLCASCGLPLTEEDDSSWPDRPAHPARKKEGAFGGSEIELRLAAVHAGMPSEVAAIAPLAKLPALMRAFAKITKRGFR